MAWHLPVDFGLSALLHLVAAREAAVTFEQEATERG